MQGEAGVEGEEVHMGMEVAPCSTVDVLGSTVACTAVRVGGCCKVGT